jgi:Mrp family chromosome partitioning ATPase
MTEQTKIPVPEGDEKNSLIERAVKALDLGSFAPPPVPQNLAPPVVKPALRQRPSVSMPAPSPKPAHPELVEGSGAGASTTPDQVRGRADVECAAASAEVEPCKFTGPHHVIDRARLRDQGLILPEGNVTALLEEFRIVKRHLLLQSADLRRSGLGGAAQRILICSAHPGEGKTYCAINLALAMAQEKESEVVLVDADFAKPSVLSTLGLPSGPGLMDALADPKVDVADCVLGTDVPGLWVLPAGDATTSDSEYLSSSRTAAVLDRLTQGAPGRIVIFDSPPALAASPAAELAKLVGQALVVVRADKTGQGAIEDAVSLLSACPNIQLLLNGIQYSPSGRRFGAYYGYGS